MNLQEEYNKWYKSLIKEYYTKNSIYKFVEYENWLEKYCFFCTAMFNTQEIFNAKKLLQIDYSDYSIEWDNFHRLVCKLQGKKSKMSPMIICSLDFKGSRGYLKAFDKLENGHFHFLMCCHPLHFEKIRRLIQPLQSKYILKKTMPLDRIEFKNIELKKFNKMNAASYQSKALTKLCDNIPPFEMERIYNHPDPKCVKKYKLNNKINTVNYNLLLIKNQIRKCNEEIRNSYNEWKF